MRARGEEAFGVFADQRVGHCGRCGVALGCGAEEWGEKWGQKEARPCQNVQVSGSEPVLDQARGGGRAEVAKWMDSGWVLN